MFRLAVLLGLLGVVSVYGQTAVEYVTIDGTVYAFYNEGFAATHLAAQAACDNINMTLPGFETDAEWTAVMMHMFNDAKSGWYWTSGRFDVPSNNWIWVNSGAILAADDPRWGSGQPGTGPYDAERVSFRMDQQVLYASSMTFEDNVMCEQKA